MKVVYKYQLPNGINDIEMPEGAETLTVMVQANTPCLWAVVDTERPIVTSRFIIIPTGEELHDPDSLMWVSTFGVSGNTFIYHVFEIINP